MAFRAPKTLQLDNTTEQELGAESKEVAGKEVTAKGWCLGVLTGWAGEGDANEENE